MERNRRQQALATRLIMASRKPLRFQFLCCTVAAAIFFAGSVLERKLLPKSPAAVSTIELKDVHLDSKPLKESDKTDGRNHNFDYDRDTWDQHSPRIAILAGPHKTASTTIQKFFVGLTGQTVLVKNTTRIARSQFVKPRYENTEWVWPLGSWEETRNKFRLLKSDAKFYAPLTSFISGRREKMFFKIQEEQTEREIQEWRARIANYFRSLFRRPWEEGKKILIAAESFDSLVLDLQENYTRASNRGEETHVSPSSSKMIDAILDLFPWENTTTGIPPLRLEDIEIQINYRTPRIDHAVSIWHQLGKRTDLRTFIMLLGSRRNKRNFYQLNSLALALQFVRKGIKTSIIDMKGVMENEALNATSVANQNRMRETTNTTIVGGLLGVLACDILKMDTDSTTPGLFCDETTSNLHLPDYDEDVESKNTKRDKKKRNMTDTQMEEINRVFEEYDCGVWQHLRKYQAKGLFRILYPSDRLFESCNADGSNPDISFRKTLEKAAIIAYRG